MQNQSEDNTNEPSEDGTSQQIQYHHYPPCVPTFDQQFTNQFPIPQNNGLVQNNIYSAALNPSIAAAQQHIAAAQQHYALYQQQMQQPPPPQQQMYYQPYPPQQQNPNLGDLNAALHLTSALINQITANNNNSAPFVHAPNLVHAPRMTQSSSTTQNQNTTVDYLTTADQPPRRTINYDHVETPNNPNNTINGPYSQLLQQNEWPSNDLIDGSKEEKILIDDSKEDSSQKEEEKVGITTQQEIIVKRRGSNTTKRQKNSSIRNGDDDQTVPVFKRKEPPELQHEEMMMDLISKPKKRRRESGAKQGRAEKSNYVTEPTPETKRKSDSVEPTTDNTSNESMVVPEDEHLVSPYIITVMRQYMRCFLDKKEGKQHSLDLGFPGLECIHCAHQYFHTNSRSISSNVFNIGDHLLTCRGAPDALKESIKELKNEHKAFKCQGRQAFFDGIFDRLLRDYKKDEICTDNKKEHLFENKNKASTSRGNTNGKKEAKSASSPATQKASVGVCRGNTNEKKEEAKKPASSLTAQKTSANSNEHPLVHAGEEQLANAYAFFVASQYKRCVVGDSKRSRLRVGFPGLECIHCQGYQQFNSDIKNMRKNFSHLSNHLTECKGASDTVKETVSKFPRGGKFTNPDAFFNNIWSRLHGDRQDTSVKKQKSNAPAKPKSRGGLEEKNIPIKSQANEKAGKKQTSKRSSDFSDRKRCHECRKKKQKCDGTRWYCLYNVGSMDSHKIADRHETASTRQPEKKSQEVHLSDTAAAEDSFLCKVISKDSAQISYPHAPMGQLWLDKSFAASRPQSDLSDEASIDIHAGGTLIGRRYVWDEGYFVDQHHDVENKPPKKNHPILRGCTCGADHSYTMGVNMESDKEGPKSRRSERSGGSIRTSTVLSKLADGLLSPHTLIYPDEYTMGPEFRFNINLLAENVQPFSIRVSPDALFLADLHAHLSDSEIIGFLGGHYSSSEKCIYIQAAFPCKATDRFDAGDTDVEMDPVSQIYAREAISNHGLSVVGWYHSHPTFQPNPSVTDIENQASYQQLFQGDNEADDITEDKSSAIPFVGLIVGTYDGQNPTSESVMRWFHVISKKAEGKDVNYPMQLKTTNRHFRVLDDELRPAMTSQGANIRQGLESKYLSCPITKRSQPSHIGASEVGDNTLSAASSTNMAEQQTEKKRPDDCQDERVTSSSNSTGNEKDHNVAIIENDRPALLLSEPLFEQPRQGNEAISWKFKSAIPLYFTTTEKEILQMDPDTVPNDVLAGIIWFAVEREQLNQAIKGESLLPASVSPSSRAILELLLRLSFTGTDEMQRKLYEVIHSLEDSESTQDSSSDEMRFNDIDAVISHKVDAVLSHYCSSTQKKINPYKSWSGAGDKGKSIVTDMDETRNLASTSTIAVNNSWAHYYLTEVLRMGCDQVGDRKVYRGGSKMKRGQKIASCLLRWARRMQLRPDFEAVMSHKSCNEGDLKFDSEISEQVAPIKNGYIFVVAEVMRLLAARWRETAGNQTRQRSRHR